MSSAAGSALSPHPDVAHAALYDGSALRRSRRRAAFMTGFLLLLAVIPLSLLGHVRAEWTLAFGRARVVSAAVAGSQPSAEFNRTCTLTQIDVTWAAGTGTSTSTSTSTRTGNFTVCADDASQFPVGKVVQVAVLPGDSSVIQGESRADAISGVAIESAVALFFLVMLASSARWLLILVTAGSRWRSGPWLPGEARPGVPARQRRRDGRPVFIFLRPELVPWPRQQPHGRTCLAKSLPYAIAELADKLGLEPDSAVDLLVQGRKDGAQLESGDQVWVAPAGRTLLRRYRSGPYAVIRASDRRVFWALGMRMPGRGW